MGQEKRQNMKPELESESGVSVIVPIYNMETSLPACVRSIANQGGCVREIILVDDGSTDGSNALCRELARNDTRIKVLTKGNGGAASARNAGLSCAHGRWIAFVDPDDTLLPDAFRRLIEAADEETDIVCGDFETIYLDGDVNKQIKKSCFFSDEITASSNEEKMPLYRQLLDSRCGQKKENFVTGIGVPWAKLYRRGFLCEQRLTFDVSLRRMQDNMFNLYAFFAAHRIRYIHQTVYRYNYGHTDKILRAYNPSYAETAQAVVIARQKALRQTGLGRDERIRRAAFNEALNLFATALKRSVFHSDNHDSFRKKAEKADALKHTAAFASLFDPGAGKAADGEKNRVFWYLSEKNCWRLISYFLER